MLSFKICLKIIICFIIFLFFSFKLKDTYLDIDNQISEYENNFDFSNFSTNIKILALYLPANYCYENSNVSENRYSTSNIKKEIKIYQRHDKSRISGKNKFGNLGYYKLSDIFMFQNQINLAKSHGIYGFAIYYYWNYKKILLEKPLELFLKNKNIDFHFLLIFENKISNFTRKVDEGKKKSLINAEENNNNNWAIKFIKDIKKFMIDKRYIRINNKVILGINNIDNLPDSQKTIEIFRRKANDFGIGELIIMDCSNKKSINNINHFNSRDADYELPLKISLNNPKINHKNIYIYNEIINNYKFNEKTNLKINLLKKNLLNFNKIEKNKDSFNINYYSNEQFYMINKILIEWKRKHHNSNKEMIFIYSWNDWNEGSYLEPDTKCGYSILNSLSKALFNLSYIYNYNLLNLRKTTKIAIQAHIYYEDLISDIIQKTNNMPVDFDFFISTDSVYKKEFIIHYIFGRSKANKIEIQIFNNKGRDVLPLLIQVKKKIKKYKYFCHIHTKKSKHIDFGDEWRNYLFNNLLGNDKIISEILTEFENNEEIGIIFPEIYYKVSLAFGHNFLGSDLKYMEQIIKLISPNLNISTKNLDFPMGNMFWARVKSVHQIFKLNFNEQFPEENKRIDGTLMHGIERIWLYIVKYNGFYYKKVLKHL